MSHCYMRIDAAKFKEQCLRLLEELDSEGIIITKRGRAIARVIPVKQQSSDLIGALEGSVEIHGDNLTTGISWKAGK